MIDKITKALQKSSFFKNSEALRFYSEHKDLLKSLPLLEARLTPFEIIKRNIYIRSLQNKLKIEEYISNIKEQFEKKQNLISSAELSLLKDENKEFIKSLASFEFDKQVIIMPLFDKSSNHIFSEDFSLLISPIYSKLLEEYKEIMINPLEYYSYSVFDSSFTRLTPLASDATSRGYYHRDFKMIFIITDQGTLDKEIYLFDKYLESINEENIYKRVKTALNVYYQNDYYAFIYELKNQDLISTKLYNILKKRVI